MSPVIWPSTRHGGTAGGEGTENDEGAVRRTKDDERSTVPSLFSVSSHLQPLVVLCPCSISIVIPSERRGADPSTPRFALRSG